MVRAGSRHVAIWISGLQAILLAFDQEPSAGSVLHTPGDGWFQIRLDGRQYAHVPEYYDAVLSQLGPEDEILILGPGQAKRELRRQIEQHGGMRGKVIGLYHASRLADAELIFPTGEIWHSEEGAAAAMASKGKLKAGFKSA